MNDQTPVTQQVTPKVITKPIPTEKLLTLRGEVHGDYFTTARLAQQLKDVLKDSPNWGVLQDVQKESIEMMCVKLARILSGDPFFIDHWDDIAGYAKLISDCLHRLNAQAAREAAERK